MGVSDSGGKFRVVTLDGELKPGLYLVTVRAVSEVSGVNAEKQNPDHGSQETSQDYPDRYRHINTTDAAIEITADQSQYNIELTTDRKSGTGGFRGGKVSAESVLQ